MRTLVLLLILPVLSSAVLGIGVLIQPDSIVDGNQVSFMLSSVPDGNGVNITLVSTFLPASPRSWYNVTNWKYDFSLQKGNVTASGANVNRIVLLVRAGGTLRIAENTGPGNARVEIPMDILPDAYTDFRVMYEVHNSSVPVTITIIQAGSKAGPEDSASTPYIYGVAGGNLDFEVLANGAPEGSHGIEVRSPGATPAITPQSTTVPPTSSPSPTPSPTAPVVSTTVPATSPPVTPNPPAVTTTVPPVPSPAPGTEGGALLLIMVYAVFIIAVTLLADYFLLKD